MKHAKLVLSFAMASVLLHDPAFACTMPPQPPPLAGESHADYQARIAREEAAQKARWAAEELAKKTAAEAGYWRDAEAIVAFRVESPYADYDRMVAKQEADYDRKVRQLKSRNKKAIPPPPPRMPPIIFDVYAKQTVTLIPFQSIRAAGSKSPFKLWNQLANTSCGPMKDGWLNDAEEGDIYVAFFRSATAFTEQNMLGILGRKEAVDPQTQALFAQWDAGAPKLKGTTEK